MQYFGIANFQRIAMLIEKFQTIALLIANFPITAKSTVIILNYCKNYSEILKILQKILQNFRELQKELLYLHFFVIENL